MLTQSNIRQVGAALMLALGISGLCLRASAQSADGQDGKLEEIVVTAQKRTENLQSVPISTQVVSGQTLSNENFNSLDTLTQTVPGVFVSSGGPTSNTLFIRGIGSGGNPSFDQSVAMFDDDIYIGRSRLSGATFLDLDRIEVLKGPQSTFFGNNAIAGAINIVTKKPGDTFDAWGRLLYGMFGQYAAEGAIGGPITDTLSARLAVTRNGDSGWITNVDTGRQAPDDNNEAARLTLVYKPTADLDATLKVEGSENRTSGAPGGLPVQWSNCPPPAPLPTAYSAFGSCAQALALGIPMGLSNNENTGLPGQQSRLSTFEDVLTINYHQWDQTFTSVTGFYNYHYGVDADLVNLPVESVTQTSPERYHQFSQELRVASAFSGSLKYLAGAYFQTDQLGWNTELNIPYLNPIIPGIPFPPFAALIPYFPIAQAAGFSQGEQVYSVFGSLGWDVTNQLTLNAGLRATRVNENAIGTVHYGTGTQLYGGFVQLPPALEPLAAAILVRPVGTSPDVSQSDRALMPSANIQYKIDPQAMAYFSYSRGFKAGGFDGESLTTANFEYGPEHVNAYELGLKSTWFDDTVLLNLDLFRSDYQDLQVESSVFHPNINTYIIQVSNAAASRAQGVEFEGRWVISKEFQLAANITYLESYYVSYTGAAQTILQGYCGKTYVLPYCAAYPNPVPQFGNLDGQPTSYAPRWSGSVSAIYGLSLPGDYKITARLSPFFSSAYNQDPNFSVLGTAAYVRLDAKIGIETPDRRWNLELIGKNLTDRIIANQALYTTSKEEPRNVALQVRWHW